MHLPALSLWFPGWALDPCDSEPVLQQHLQLCLQPLLWAPCCAAPGSPFQPRGGLLLQRCCRGQGEVRRKAGIFLIFLFFTVSQSAMRQCRSVTGQDWGHYRCSCPLCIRVSHSMFHSLFYFWRGSVRGKLHPLNLIPDLCVSSLVYVFFLLLSPLLLRDKFILLSGLHPVWWIHGAICWLEMELAPCSHLG